MNLSLAKADALADKLVAKQCKLEDREVILFVSFLQLPSVAKIIDGSNIGLGGQNMYCEDRGAFTGEESALNLKEVGCTHILLGHSERRHYFNEDYETVNKKVHCALKSGLKILLCVGESLEEREKRITEMVVVDQVETAFTNVSEKELKNIYITYEPIWAIGTGKNASVNDAAHVHEIIRKDLKRHYNEEQAQKMHILYGGSVKPENISSFLKNEEIDGVLIGGASLKASSFISMINTKV